MNPRLRTSLILLALHAVLVIAGAMLKIQHGGVMGSVLMIAGLVSAVAGALMLVTYVIRTAFRSDAR